MTPKPETKPLCRSLTQSHVNHFADVNKMVPKLIGADTSGTPLCPECVEWPCECKPKDVYIIGRKPDDGGA